MVGPGGNHPPAILSAKIYPVDVRLDTELRIEVKAEDMDGDRVTYRYQWFVNGTPAATGPVFKPESSKKGDRITAELIPNDGKVDGPVFRTNPVTMGNFAPYIVEIHLEPVPLHRGEQLKVKVVAEDPDGDPVTLTYKWFRNNREIPGATSDTLDTKDFQKKDVSVGWKIHARGARPAGDDREFAPPVHLDAADCDQGRPVPLSNRRD